MKLSKGWIAALAIVGIVLIIGLWIGGTYNGLVSQQENVKAKWGNVQSAYQRRADLIPNLVDTVKGAKNFEQQTLTQITQLRSQAGQIQQTVQGAQNPGQLQDAETQMGGVLSRLMVIVEAYPDLKSNENFLSLQDELAGTENRIKTERDNYNTAVQSYNVAVRTFPSNIISGMFGFGVKEPFAADAGADKVPTVTF